MTPADARKNGTNDNDRVAADLRAEFRRRAIACVNLVASPGAGKTTFLEHTLQAMVGGLHRPVVLAGDVQAERDAERLARFGFPARQVSTGGACHLDAAMVHRTLADLPLDGVDLVFIENVASLACPGEFDLGQTATVVMLSAAEGDDKPLKYPAVFRRADLMILHKVDLVPYTRFDLAVAREGARRANPAIEIIETSCVRSPGLKAWLEWVDARTAQRGASYA